MQKLTTYILTIAGLMAFMAGGLVLLDTTARRMDAIEQAQDCKYDYNGLCYTRDARPWIFND